MKKKNKQIPCSVILFLGMTFLMMQMIFLPTSFADDLDDGIPIDDKLDDYYKLKREKNMLFVERHARTKIAMKTDSADGFDSDSSYALQGSVYLGPGAKADEITIIYKAFNSEVVSINK